MDDAEKVAEQACNQAVARWWRAVQEGKVEGVWCVQGSSGVRVVPGGVWSLQPRQDSPVPNSQVTSGISFSP